MAFTSLLSIVALAAYTVAAPSASSVVCSDGTRVSSAVCCNFVPVKEVLQTQIFQNQCGEDAHEALRLVFRKKIIQPTPKT